MSDSEIEDQSCDTYDTIEDEMNRNQKGDKYSQLSPRGMGYFVFQLPDKLILRITLGFMSLLRALSTSTSASSIFGAFNESRSAVDPDDNRKSFSTKKIESSDLTKLLKRCLREKEISDSEIEIEIDNVVSFVQEFRDFLANKQFIKDLTKSTENKFDITKHIILTVITSISSVLDQADHFDFNPEGLCFLFS